MKQAKAAATIALIGAQALFVAAYIGHEHTIYYWDHAMYFGMARQFYFALTQNFAGGWGLFANSLTGNYNLIFALPSLIGFALFGATRLVFIATNFLVFFLAYEVALAFFLRRTFGFDWAKALIVSLIGCAFVPPLWLPLLEGYPDAGAAACVIFAVALALNGPGQEKTIRGGFAVGLFLGLAVLLRRHFVYADLSLIGALVLLAFLDIWRGKERWGDARRAAIYFAACGAGFAGILLLIAPGFVWNALTVNYGALYLSYQRPPAVFLYFVLGGFGFGLLAAAVSGLFLTAHSEAGKKPVALVALFTFLWLTVWCLGPDEMGHHYILHALPFFAVTGIAGWFVFWEREKNAKKYIWGGALALFLAANSAWALWFSPSGVWPNDNGTPGLFSAPRPPVIRADYDEWLRLADYLRRTTSAEDRIMLVGSSFVFNQDLLHSIYTDILGAPEMTARFPKAPEIDHEEPAPLDVFAASNIYVVPEPAQYHLDPAGQRVVTAAADRFPPPAARAGMFRADAAEFHLADNTTVKIWRRADWTPAALFEAMDAIRRDGPQDPRFEQDWVTKKLPLAAQIHTDDSNHTAASALFDPEHRDTYLFFDYPLGAGSYRIEFFAASDCPGLTFRFAVLGADGKAETLREFAPVSLPGQNFQEFTVAAKPAGDRFLRLDLSTKPASLCRAALGDLLVERMP